MELRVLVVDDTVIFRQLISDAIDSIPDMKVIGRASNGKFALEWIKSLHPDVITLDIEMPVMNGLEVLEAIRSQNLEVGVIMLSSLTRRGSEMTIRALELGAFDFLTKPTDGSLEENSQEIQEQLAPILKAFAQHQEIHATLRGKTPVQPVIQVKEAQKPAIASGTGERVQQITKAPPAEMVLIGISTGGPAALARVLPQLPADLGVPIFIVQHMPAQFTISLAKSLDKVCAIQVKEAEHGEEAKPDVAYIAPGGKQFKLGKDLRGKVVIKITDDPPENNCKPSADYLFRSAAHNFPGRCCAVIMTGMGTDGTSGLKLIKRNLARVIAQDEASCVVFGMPKEAIAAGVVDIVVPLEEIAVEICKAV